MVSPFLKLMLFFVLDSKKNVDHRKHGKYEGLHECDESAERVEETGHNQRNQVGENSNHHVIGRNVPIETKIEGKHPETSADELKGEDQPGEHPDRSAKMLDIRYQAVVLDALIVKENK